MSRRITAWLAAAPPGVLAAYAVVCSFATYFTMFAFRKPFTAASYEEAEFAGHSFELKAALGIGQIVGYGLAKVVGMKLCSETPRRRRAALLAAMILLAEAALALFAVAPPAWKPAAMFLNGLPLGMVWGLVVWYLEGRRASEILLAGLSCSFIIASGVMKDVGRAVLAGDPLPLLGATIPNPLPPVSEAWMPAAVGGMFLLPYMVAVWLLDQLPEPTAADVAARSPRTTMDAAERTAFVRRFLPGMTLLLIAYFFVNAFREFRDIYTVDVYAELGYAYDDHRTIVTQSELWVGLGVVSMLGLVYFIRDNARGLTAVFGVMTLGVALLGGATWLQMHNEIDGFWWMTLIGLGSYLAYVPFGSVLFERLMASTRMAGTAVFAIYLADSFGYAGSISVLAGKGWWSQATKVEFLRAFAIMLSLGGAACLLLSAVYFRKAISRQMDPPRGSGN